MTVPGQAHGLTGTESLLEGLESGALAGDRAFDADWLLEELDRRGAEAVIPSKKNHSKARKHDRTVCGWRHPVESFFAKIKQFRAVATRYDRTLESFAATVHPVAGVIAAK